MTGYNSNCLNDFEAGKSTSWSHKNPVRDFIALWCLPTQYESGKWVRLPLPNRTQRVNDLCEEMHRCNRLGMCTNLQEIFFASEQIGSRVKCPTLTHRIVWRTRKLWGTFEVAAFWLSISDRTIAIIKTALGAIMRSLHQLQNLENLAEIWHTDICLQCESGCENFARRSSTRAQHCCESAHGGHAYYYAEQAHPISNLLFESFGAGRWLIVSTSERASSVVLTFGYWVGERPVQQVLVFCLFFLNDLLNDNKILGGAGNARQKVELN